MRTNTPIPDFDSIRPLGTCQRCSFLYHLDQLQWQLEYRGMQLQSAGYRVCPSCYDEPQPQLKPVVLPPDPVAVPDARPFDYVDATVDYLAEEDGDRIVEEDGIAIITQPNGDVMLDDLYD